MTTIEQAEKRREQVYTLYLRGASLRQIAEKLGIPRSVAQYDIVLMRKQNGKWYDQNKDPEARFRGMYKELWDRHIDAYVEAWSVYQRVDEKNVWVRANLFGQVCQCLDKLRSLFNKITPSLDDVERQKIVADLEARIAAVEEANKKS